MPPVSNISQSWQLWALLAAGFAALKEAVARRTRAIGPQADYAMAIREALPDAVSVFIEPPSFEELVRRLKGRNTEAAADIDRRLEESRVELAAMAEFDHRVLNDDVERAVEELAAIVDAETRMEHA